MAEAKSAGVTVGRRHNLPGRFALDRKASSEDHWLNAIAALVDRGLDVWGNGSGPEGRYISGVIDDLIDASKIACVRLAVGHLPTSRQLTAHECYELSRLIAQLDAVINVAVAAQYSEESRAAVTRLEQYTGDWLSLHLGAVQRQNFVTIEPFSRIYTAVPESFMAEWQLSAGRLMHLRSLASRWCSSQLEPR